MKAARWLYNHEKTFRTLYASIRTEVYTEDDVSRVLFAFGWEVGQRR